MGRDTYAGRGGRGGTSGRGGRGRGGRGRGANATVPRKASEVGACKELEGHIFTIGSGNKGKCWRKRSGQSRCSFRPLTHASVDRAYQAESVGDNSLL